MNRDRGAIAGVEHAVYRHRGHGERLAGAQHARPRPRVDPQQLLADVARDHGDRGAGDVVVVEAGVLVLAPADDPGVDVLVFPDELVDAGVVGVPDEVAPALRPVGQVLCELLELLKCEGHKWRVTP